MTFDQLLEPKLSDYVYAISAAVIAASVYHLTVLPVVREIERTVQTRKQVVIVSLRKTNELCSGRRLVYPSRPGKKPVVRCSNRQAR